MQKKISLLLVFIFISTNIKAQQKIIDSLEQQLINPTNGKTKTENLIQLGFYYSTSNPKKGLERLEEATKLTTISKDSFRLAVAIEHKGLNYKSLGKDSLAFDSYDKAEEIFKAIDSTHELAKLMFNKGMFYSERSNYPKAIENTENAVNTFLRGKDTLLTGYSLSVLGYYRISTGDYINSQKDFLKGKSLLEKIGQKESIYYASLEANMGILYQRLSKYDEALEMHQRALKIFEKNGLEHLMASQYSEIATIYSQKKKKYKEALELYKKSLKINKKNQNKIGVSGDYANIGLTYSHLKTYKKAISYLDSAIAINKALKIYDRLSISYHNKGEAYYKSNEILKARKNFDSSHIYAKKINDKRMMYEAKLGVSQTASMQGDYKTAYNVIDEAVIIRDSLISDDKKEQLATLKAKYEFDKEKAILEATHEKDKAIDAANLKRQVLIRNLSIVGGILGLLLLGVGLTLFRRKKEAELNAQLATTELQKLKAQMNPHFIFNTLGSINDFILKNKKEEASNYLVQFSTMMRKILDNSQEEEISLQEEIAFLDNYLKLEQQRLNQKFTYNITVDEAIHTENTYIPPSLLQPYVENSVWHGISPKLDNDGQINIDFTIKNNALVCTIDDNGVGLQEKNTVNRTSFSTKSAENRLNILNTLKGSNAKVNIIEKEQGIRVIIQLPLSVE